MYKRFKFNVYFDRFAVLFNAKINIVQFIINQSSEHISRHFYNFIVQLQVFFRVFIYWLYVINTRTTMLKSDQINLNQQQA